MNRRRQKLKEIKWSKTSVLTNVFAVYNWIIGQPWGIQVRAYTVADGSGFVLHEFYCYQSLAIYLEHCFYQKVLQLLSSPLKAIRDLSRIRVYVPQFSNYTAQYQGYVFAVADGDTSFGTEANTGTSITFDHVVASGEAVVAGVTVRNGADTVSGVTYNASSLTASVAVFSGENAEIYHKTNPSTGTNSLVATVGSTDRTKVCTALSLSGTDTSDFIEDTDTIIASGTSVSHALTTAATDAFGFMAFIFASTDAITPAAGQTTIFNNTVSGETYSSRHLHTYKAFPSSGSNTIGCSWTTSRGRTSAAIAINAATATGTTVSPAAQVGTFSLPAPTIVTGSAVTPSAQSATFALPALTIVTAALISPNAQSATFSLPSPAILAGGALFSANPQVATFSQPSIIITKDTIVTPNAVTATFAQAAITVLFSITVSVSAVVATFAQATIAKVGSVWNRTSRSTDSTWTRTSRNSD